MSFNINTFKSRLKFGGARSSLFEVVLTFPTSLGSTDGNGISDATNFSAPSNDQLRFMCKGSAIPASAVGVIEIPFQGRKIKAAGTKSFTEWAITIINDEDFSIRKAFEHWIASLNGHATGSKNSGVTSSMASYQSQGKVIQYDQNSKPIRVYKFVNVFPSEISAMELSWENDQIQEFSVTLQYDYWETEKVGL